VSLERKGPRRPPAAQGDDRCGNCAYYLAPTSAEYGQHGECRFQRLPVPRLPYGWCAQHKRVEHRPAAAKGDN
jgi:hypothetical protein